MGRSRSALWAHFTKITPPEFKTLRAKCNHFKESVSATPSNTTTHMKNCSMLRQTNSQLSFNEMPTKNSFKGSNTQTSAPSDNFPNLSNLITRTVTSKEKIKIYHLFAKAMHQSAKKFYLFDSQPCYSCFAAFNTSWKLPSPYQIYSHIVDNCYDSSMKNTFDCITKAKGGVISIEERQTSSQTLSVMSYFILRCHSL